MSHFIRASKYRHIFVDQPKTENSYTGFELSTATGEQSYIKGNTKFFAVAVRGGGGPLAVIPYAQTGRYKRGEQPLISGHKGAVMDFDFNPFHENLIGSASDDSTIKVWGIPEGGLTEHITEPLVDLHGHGRKVTLLKFHPTAQHIVSSASGDFTVKLWDIEKAKDLVTFGGMSQLIQDLCWDHYGNLCATSCKDKTVRIYDGRSGEVAFEKANAHEGAKSVKMTFLGPKEKLLTVGFTRQSQRQMKIWDHRKMDKEIKKLDIDQAAGVLMPFYDPDTAILYLAGKGDGNVRYYEMCDAEPFCFGLSEYRSTKAQKGVTFIPKRGLDIMGCETARALKLAQSGQNSDIEVLRFIVPRKSESFQEDLFPDTCSGMPSVNADQWMAGESKPPVLMTLDPSGASHAPEASAGAAAAPYVAPKSAATLQKELDAANAKIAELEAKLKAAGL